MSKIVYFLGAGASYGRRDEDKEILEGLPVVNEISRELCNYRDWMRDSEDLGGSYKILGKERAFVDVQATIVRDIETFIDAMPNYPTIDALAKALYDNYDGISDIGVKCSNLYGYLKFLMSSFFMYEQCCHSHDSRYDSFLSEILTTDGEIPDNIYFLTWNYDMQLELAYRLKTGKPLRVCIPVEKEGYSKDAKVFKINGSANFYNVNHLDCLMVKDKNDLIKRIFNQFGISHFENVNNLSSGYSSGTTDLYFSWEKEVYDQKSNSMKQNIQDADTLVIIGYSFPDVNAIIDTEIFDSMPNLKNIYIQDCYPEQVMKKVMERVHDLHGIQVVPMSDVSKFYVPYLQH